MAYQKFIARLSRSSLLFFKKLYNFLDALMSGFWLGVMSEKSLDFYDDLHYNQSAKYTDDEYNLSGLFDWENDRIQKYFLKVRNILLIAAGGGRETIALSRMGFKVDSYECNRTLVEYGNLFLQRNNCEGKIRYLSKNSVPADNKYDGIIIGWGAYSHIRGNKKRISLLVKLHQFLDSDSPLMISFLTREEQGRQEAIIKKVSDFFRFFRNKAKTESGDRLISSFVHFFREEEIRKELAQSQYRVIDYYDIYYGCLIAKIITHNSIK